MLDAAELLAILATSNEGVTKMSYSVYKARRRQILNGIMSARRCKLPVIVRRYQNELINLRIAAIA